MQRIVTRETLTYFCYLNFIFALDLSWWIVKERHEVLVTTRQVTHQVCFLHSLYHVTHDLIKQKNTKINERNAKRSFVFLSKAGVAANELVKVQVSQLDSAIDVTSVWRF